jgi:hypothetical protein
MSWSAASATSVAAGPGETRRDEAPGLPWGLLTPLMVVTWGVLVLGAGHLLLSHPGYDRPSGSAGRSRGEPGSR